MSRTTLFALAFGIAIACTAEQEKPEPPPHVKAYLKECKKQRKEAIARTEEHLERCKKRHLAAKNGKVDPNARGIISGSEGTTYPSKEAMKRGIKDAGKAGKRTEKRLKELKRNRPFYLAELQHDQLAVGGMGRLRANDAWVLQVLGEEDALIRVSWYHGPHFAPSGRGAFTRPPPGTRKVLWLRGVATAGLVTKGELKYDEVLHITGTKTYGLADGDTNTVFVLEPIDLRPYLPGE